MYTKNGMLCWYGLLYNIANISQRQHFIQLNSASQTKWNNLDCVTQIYHQSQCPCTYKKAVSEINKSSI